MKKNLKILIIAFLGIVIFVTGCTRGNTLSYNLLSTNTDQSSNYLYDNDNPLEQTATAVPDITETTKEGWITFWYDHDGNPDIFLLSPDFSQIFNLGLIGLRPRGMAISPDGSAIGFIGFQNTYDIFLADLRCPPPIQICSKTPRRLTNDNEIYTNDLSWSPDGRKIAYSSRGAESIEGNSIGILDIETMSQTEFINSRGKYPSWSPDGEIILFTSPSKVCELGECQGELYYIDLENNDLHHFEIPSLRDAYDAEWSPDGKFIIFVSSEPYRCGEFVCIIPNIYLIDSDGNNLELLVEGGDHPSWSPDGIKIVFQRDDGLYIINQDGTGLTQIFTSNISGYNLSPDW